MGTRRGTALRGSGGALALAVMFYLALAPPGLLSDREQHGAGPGAGGPAVSAATDGGFAAYEAPLAAYDARRAEARAANKAALFDILAAAGIAVVVVTFDGRTDAGQIEEVTAFDADDNPVELPGGTVGTTQVAFDSQAVATAQETPRTVVEA